MERGRRQRGLSIIEVMVGLAILGIVSSQAFAMLQSQLQTYHSQKRVLDVQEDSRMVADMILLDVRMAGFMVPDIAGVASRDGGNAASDALCVSEWSLMDQDALDDANARFDRAGLVADLGGGAISVDLTAAEMDIDDDGDDDFLVGSGIIVSDGTESHCARITAVGGSVVSFTPRTPAGFLAPAASSRAVPAIVYELNGTSLTRNGLLLSTQVEDLQVEFGVDNDGDDLLGVGEFPLDTLTGSDHAAIMQVRLSVLTRTSSEDQQLTGAGRQAVANRAAGAADDFRRRLVTTTAAPRNLL